MRVYDSCVIAAEEIYAKAGLKRGDLVIVGCSTSEVIGKKIGSAGTLDTAEEILNGLLHVFSKEGICLLVQCCEHLNRAVVMPRKEAEAHGFMEVCVLPQPHAGGSLATAYFQRLEDPVVVESVRAKAGLDIGDTLIGMHLKRVAVPLRLSIDKIGEAHLVAAYTRPPLIGGARAQYPDPSIR